MKQLEVADEVHAQVALLAKAWNTSVSDVIRRLLAEFRSEDAPSAPAKPKFGEVAVHAIYAGIRTDGLFNQHSGSLTISSGPLAGRTYSKPSGAAVALVQIYSPEVNPNRNGWSFWVVSRTGQRLQAIRHERPHLS
jgi:hypothetical protein